MIRDNLPCDVFVVSWQLESIRFIIELAQIAIHRVDVNGIGKQ